MPNIQKNKLENRSCIPKPTVFKYAAKHYLMVTSVDHSVFFQKKNSSRSQFYASILKNKQYERYFY